MTPYLIPAMREMNAWVHDLIPEWPRLETSPPQNSLYGAVDVWCPTLDDINPRLFKQRQAKGENFWLYTVWERPGVMIDFPATDHRLISWICWKYGVKGFLYYGTTHWGSNAEGEQRWPEVPWKSWNEMPGHNGCGYLIYPGLNGTPLSSMRFEAIRDGIEDYEYFYMLRDLLSRLGDKVPADLRKRAETELAVTEDVVTDNKHFTEDPNVLMQARDRVANLIEEIQELY